MTLSKEKQDALKQKMQSLGISEDDLVEKFILGSGSGGQKINKTSSCVYLKHLPTGIEIKCQKERSRELNRFYARRFLVEEIEKRLFQRKTAKIQENEKIRRQKKRRTRRQQLKTLEDKSLHSAKKKLRTIGKERD